MTTKPSEDSWNFYLCEIDGHPHSTFVDLALIDEAPIKGLGVFLCVELDLKHPHPDHGMSTAAEFERLEEIENFVGTHQTATLKYVARQTGDRKRKFYFYGQADSDLTTLHAAMAKAFPDYTSSTFHFEDAGWQAYIDDIYPNEMAMNDISNRAVYQQLANLGDDLNIPREIDHTFQFSTLAQAQEFETIVKQAGYAVTIEPQDPPGLTYEVLAQRIDPPARLDPITFELSQLAAQMGGSYDGWGCRVAPEQA